MENLDKALESVGESIVAEVRKLAKKDKFHATDSLDKSISYKIKGNIVEISANKYIEALSGGIKRQNGSKEDFNQKLENIKAWARTKGIQPRGRNGKFVVRSEYNMNKMAWAISKKIANSGISKRFGYKGSGFLEEMQKNVVKNVTDMVAEAYKLDIIVKLKEI